MRLVDCFIEPAAYILDVVRSPAIFPDYASVRAKTEALLDASAAMAGTIGISAQDYRDGRFALCAWMDEAVLGSAWPGRDQWLHQPLQRAIFDTVNAGEEFFLRLDRLLRRTGLDPETAAPSLSSVKDLEFGRAAGDQAPPGAAGEGLPGGTGPDGADAAARGVIEVFALALTLGFTGRYFQAEDQGVLRHLRRLAREAALGMTERVSPTEGTRLCPALYERPEPPGARRRRFWRGLDLADMLVIGLPLLITVAMFAAYGSILSAALARFWGGS